MDDKSRETGLITELSDILSFANYVRSDFNYIFIRKKIPNTFKMNIFFAATLIANGNI